MPKKLKRVIRLDSQPLSQTFFTPEGYLRDRPILTSTGIFEYTNLDGSIRKELRLPEEVFDPESLKSYKGAPIIVTHDAGLIDKDNVADEQIGTILSEGYRDGDDVRAEIIIHDTDAVKESGLRELSLGYNLDLDETPGVWEGEPYDAIQRNIRINHLALVREARAGDQARLNIDGRDSDRALKGGKLMYKNKTTKKAVRRDSAAASRKRHTTAARKTRKDGILSPEELAKAIEEYKAKHGDARCKADEEDEPTKPAFPRPGAETEEDDDDEEEIVAVAGDDDDVEEKVEMVKDHRDRRDEEGEPETLEDAEEVIANQDEDIDILFDIIDTLLAEIAFDEEGNPFVKENGEENDDDDEPEDEVNGDDDEEEKENPFAEDDEDDEENEDDDDSDIPFAEEDEDDEENEDDDEEKPGTVNADSVDRIVRERVKIAKAASTLNMDGLENINPMKAKKKIIHAVRPNIRLDGKSAAYVNAMFDCACDEIQRSSRKDTMYQRHQMFNRDSRSSRRNTSSSEAHRDRMIARMQKRNRK